MSVGIETLLIHRHLLSTNRLFMLKSPCYRCLCTFRCHCKLCAFGFLALCITCKHTLFSSVPSTMSANEQTSLADNQLWRVQPLGCLYTVNADSVCLRTDLMGTSFVLCILDRQWQRCGKPMDNTESLYSAHPHTCYVQLAMCTTRLDSYIFAAAGHERSYLVGQSASL